MHTEEDAANQVTNQQKFLVIVESYPMNIELHLGTKLHSDAESQNEVDAHSDSKISVHDRDILKYLTKIYIVILKLKDKMKKQDLSQDCPNMSKDIILLLKLLEIKMQDQ